MRTAQRLTPVQRNRAIERLHALKTGAVVVGVTATVGFGWVAAMSNPGTQASAATTTSGDSTTSSSSSSSTSSTSTINGLSNGSSFGSIFIGGSSSGRIHAVSGGS